MKIILGKIYKDKISGFTGIAFARSIFLYGCIRILIVSNRLDKDGKLIDDCWFDEEQLAKVKETKKSIKKNKTNTPAGTRGSDASRRSDS